MKFLSRTELCALTALTPSRFDVRLTRGQFPKMPGSASAGIDRYWPIVALVAIIADDMKESQLMSLSAAAERCSLAFIISKHMRDIAKTSREMEAGETPKAEIFFAWLMVAGESEPRAICGTLAKIAKTYQSPRSITLVNVSAAAATMRARATIANIDLEDFWRGG